MTKQKTKLPNRLTTVTNFSKAFALLLFFILPIMAFYLGHEYGQLQCLAIY